MNTLVAYQIALEVIRQVRPIMERIKQHDPHLADQLKRAATNTVANLGEGREAGNKRRAYENAHGEAREMVGCLDSAEAWGLITEADGAEARRTLDRLLGLCWGLTHPRRRTAPQ